MEKVYCTALILLLLAGCAHHQKQPQLQVCDLLFFCDTRGMGAAVRESTGEYTHVALVAKAKGDSVWIIDATQQYGVSKRLLDKEECAYEAYRLIDALDTAGITARAHALIGLPYDQAFMPDNGAYYCSELIHECYLDTLGNHLFEAYPMNWRAADGRMPQYWVNHFNELGIPIPEGVLGTNPTALAVSPRLRRIE